jgi:hypothetical protein
MLARAASPAAALPQDLCLQAGSGLRTVPSIYARRLGVARAAGLCPLQNIK